ncbi:MAG: P-loop NTPase [Solirubrobacterales bacterium]|nr:P-loop NTPase [Solirubrobacterales bacterium]
MTDDLLGALWRRRRLFVGALLGCFAAVVLATALQPEKYEATVVLVAASSDDSASEEQLVRTFSSLATNTNIVDLVRAELPLELSRDELLERMSFSPVPRTQLLEITAEGSSGREAQVIANTYATVFAVRVRDQAGDRSSEGSLSLSEPAARPANPARPSTLVYLGLGGALSVLLALGVIIVREMARPRLPVERDHATLFDLPILARVPKLGRSRDGAEDVIAADAFNWLAISLDHAGEDPPEVIVVTSPTEGDGKSAVVRHLALALLRAGRRVAVLEADLRHPGLQISPPGAMRRSTVGLGQHLHTGEHAPIIQDDSAIPGLGVIWAGDPIGYPGTLLASPRFGQLVRQLASAYDRVIIDTPPLAVGADAAIVASQADGVICVVDAQRTSEASSVAGLTKLEAVRAPVLGVVLNRAEPVGVSGYYREGGAQLESTAG